jgi:hypothetical protein
LGSCMLSFFKKRRRQRLYTEPFPVSWLAIIKRSFPIYDRLPQSDQQELQGHIQVFLAEKVFEGCGGLELTDEIKVTIAAQACRLTAATTSARSSSSVVSWPGTSGTQLRFLVAHLRGSTRQCGARVTTRRRSRTRNDRARRTEKLLSFSRRHLEKLVSLPGSLPGSLAGFLADVVKETPRVFNSFFLARGVGIDGC